MMGDETKDADQLKGLADKAFGHASENFGKELAPIGSEAGKVAVDAARRLLNICRAIIWGYDQIESWVVSQVAPKIEQIPPENLVEPDPRIVGPAIEAMRFAHEDKEIREMFARLISGDMNSAIKNSVHPSFVEIIKQIDAADSRVFRELYKRGSQIHFVGRLYGADKSNRAFKSLDLLITFSAPAVTTMTDLLKSLNSLQRVGLVDVTDSHRPANPSLLKIIDQYKEGGEYKSLVEKLGERKLKDHFRGIYVTPLGKAFGKVCVEA